MPLGFVFGKMSISRAENLNLIFAFFGFSEIFDISSVFHESPQNLCIDFKHMGPNLRSSPQNLREKQLKNLAREISPSARAGSKASAGFNANTAM